MQSRVERSIPHDVWAVAFTSLFSDWSYEMLLPILPFFLSIDLGASPLVVGVVEGSAVAAQSLVQWGAGLHLSRRENRRVLGSAGYATTTAADGLIALASTWPVAAVLRAIAWAARGERLPIKKAILGDAAAGGSVGRAFGLEQTFDSLGAVAGTISAAAVVATQGVPGLRTVFAVSVLPGLVAVILFYRLVWDRDRQPTSPARVASAGRPQLPRSFWLFLIPAAVFGLASFNILLGLLRVGTGLLKPGGPGFGSTILVALVAYLAYNLVYTGLSYPAGLLSDRTPRLGLVAVAYALFVPVDLLFILPPTVVVGLLAFVTAGAQVALADVAQSAWVSRSVDTAQRGSAFGYLGAVQGVGTLGASALVGGLWTAYSPALAFTVSAILAATSAIILLPAVLLSSKPRDPSR